MPLAFSSVFNSIIFTRQLFVNITCHILIDPNKGNRRGRIVFPFHREFFLCLRICLFQLENSLYPNICIGNSEGSWWLQLFGPFIQFQQSLAEV